eukprot:1743781-Pyramimonas_sp.AAC.1
MVQWEGSMKARLAIPGSHLLEESPGGEEERGRFEEVERSITQPHDVPNSHLPPSKEPLTA